MRSHWIEVVAVCAVFLLSGVGCTKRMPDADLRAAAKKQADGWAQAMVRGDTDTLTTKTYTPLFAMAEKTDRRPPKATDLVWPMKAREAEIRSIVVGDVTDLKEANDEEFAVVPVTSQVTIYGDNATCESYLLAISDNDGVTWQFIDACQMNELGIQMHDIVPHLPDDMAYPKHKEPVFTEATPGFSLGEMLSNMVSKDLERADYKIKLPVGSIVQGVPGKANDLNHFTSVIIPNGTALLIFVSDDKSMGEIQYKAMTTELAKKFAGSTVTPSDLFDARKGHAELVSGNLNGVPFGVETGSFAGRSKEFMLMYTYRQGHAEEARKVLRKIVDTFVVKD